MSAHDPASLQNLLKVLEYHFGYKQFREGQLRAVQATLSQHDSMVILPTGAGKSLCFQLPPLCKDYGFAVVVGPLIALARDQVQRAQELDIDAELWNCEVSDDKRGSILRDIVSDSPSLKLLYATPESLRNPKLREYLQEAAQQGTLVSFAIDEAHCVSEWGHDFRPAYLELASLRADFPNVPVAAFTASCTKDVMKTIISVLALREPVLIQSSFNRPNIQYKVVYKGLLADGSEEAAVQHLVEFITARKGQSGIIYARLRKTCDWLASVLCSHELEVASYHAGKDAAQRRKVQSEWNEGATDCVVATIAFGMGIDSAHVRYVVHWNAAASMEDFYQESGRVGRDGLPALSVVYASREDLDASRRLERGGRQGAVQEMAGLLLEPGCRRRKILRYFGESREACQPSEQQCDFCAAPDAVRQQLRRLDNVQQARESAAQRGSSGDGQEDEGSPAADGGAPEQRLKAAGAGWGSATALRDTSNGLQAAQQPGSRAAGRVPMLKPRCKAAAQQPGAEAEMPSPVAVAASIVECAAVPGTVPAALDPQQAGGAGHAQAAADASIPPAAAPGSMLNAQRRAASAVRRAFVPPKMVR